jgi:hypothetical protein
VRRGAIAAGLVAFFLVGSAQHFDQPRPRGAEIAAEQEALERERGPTPPFGGPERSRGCPRETLIRFSAFEAWLRELPLGWFVADVAIRRMIGSCSPV